MGTAGWTVCGDSIEMEREYINKVFYWVFTAFFFCLLKKDKLLFHPDTLPIQKHLISIMHLMALESSYANVFF